MYIIFTANKQQSIIMKVNAMYALKYFIQLVQYPLINMIEVYLLPIILKISLFKCQDRSYDNMSQYFQSEGYSVSEPNIKELSYNYMILCDDLIFMAADIKPYRSFQSAQMPNQKSQFALAAQQLNKNNILPKKAKNEQDKNQQKLLRQKYLKNLSKFVDQSQLYILHFIQKVEQYIIKGPKQYKETLDFRRIMKFGDVFLTSQAILHCCQALQNSNLFFKKNALSLIHEFVVWGDIEAIMMVNYNEYVEKIIFKVSEVKGDVSLLAGQDIYPEILGQKQMKQLFYNDFLLCLHTWAMCFPHNTFDWTEQSLQRSNSSQEFSPIYNHYVKLKQEFKFIFPENPYLKKHKKDFQENIHANTERNRQILMHFQQNLTESNNSSAISQSFRSSKIQKLQSNKIVKEQRGSSLISAHQLNKMISDQEAQLQKLLKYTEQNDLQKVDSVMKRANKFPGWLQENMQLLDQGMGDDQLEGLITRGLVCSEKVEKINEHYASFKKKKINLMKLEELIKYELEHVGTDNRSSYFDSYKSKRSQKANSSSGASGSFGIAPAAAVSAAGLAGATGVAISHFKPKNQAKNSLRQSPSSLSDNLRKPESTPLNNNSASSHINESLPKQMLNESKDRSSSKGIKGKQKDYSSKDDQDQGEDSYDFDYNKGTDYGFREVGSKASSAIQPQTNQVRHTSTDFGTVPAAYDVKLSKVSSKEQQKSSDRSIASIRSSVKRKKEVNSNPIAPIKNNNAQASSHSRGSLKHAQQRQVFSDTFSENSSKLSKSSKASPAEPNLVGSAFNKSPQNGIYNEINMKAKDHNLQSRQFLKQKNDQNNHTESRRDAESSKYLESQNQSVNKKKPVFISIKRTSAAPQSHSQASIQEEMKPIRQQSASSPKLEFDSSSNLSNAKNITDQNAGIGLPEEPNSILSKSHANRKSKESLSNPHEMMSFALHPNAEESHNAQHKNMPPQQSSSTERISSIEQKKFKFEMFHQNSQGKEIFDESSDKQHQSDLRSSGGKSSSSNKHSAVRIKSDSLKEAPMALSYQPKSGNQVIRKQRIMLNKSLQKIKEEIQKEQNPNLHAAFSNKSKSNKSSVSGVSGHSRALSGRGPPRSPIARGQSGYSRQSKQSRQHNPINNIYYDHLSNFRDLSPSKSSRQLFPKSSATHSAKDQSHQSSKSSQHRLSQSPIPLDIRKLEALSFGRKPIDNHTLQKNPTHLDQRKISQKDQYHVVPSSSAKYKESFHASSFASSSADQSTAKMELNGSLYYYNGNKDAYAGGGNDRKKGIKRSENSLSSSKNPSKIIIDESRQSRNSESSSLIGRKGRRSSKKLEQVLRPSQRSNQNLRSANSSSSSKTSFDSSFSSEQQHQSKVSKSPSQNKNIKSIYQGGSYPNPLVSSSLATKKSRLSNMPQNHSKERISKQLYSKIQTSSPSQKVMYLANREMEEIRMLQEKLLEAERMGGQSEMILDNGRRKSSIRQSMFRSNNSNLFLANGLRTPEKPRHHLSPRQTPLIAQDNYGSERLLNGTSINKHTSFLQSSRAAAYRSISPTNFRRNFDINSSQNQQYLVNPTGTIIKKKLYQKYLFNLQSKKQKKRLLRSKDLCYKDRNLEIGLTILRERQRLKLVYFVLPQKEITSFKLEILPPSSKHVNDYKELDKLTIQISPVTQSIFFLQPQKQYKVYILTEINQFPYTLPQIRFTYSIDNRIPVGQKYTQYTQKKEYLSVLPVYFVKFIDIQPVSHSELQAVLESKQLYRTEQFPFNSRLIRTPNEIHHFLPNMLCISQQYAVSVYCAKGRFFKHDFVFKISIKANNFMFIQGRILQRGEKSEFCQRVMEWFLVCLQNLFIAGSDSQDEDKQQLQLLQVVKQSKKFEQMFSV